MFQKKNINKFAVSFCIISFIIGISIVFLYYHVTLKNNQEIILITKIYNSALINQNEDALNSMLSDKVILKNDFGEFVFSKREFLSRFYRNDCSTISINMSEGSVEFEKETAKISFLQNEVCNLENGQKFTFLAKYKYFYEKQAESWKLFRVEQDKLNSFGR